ncbi:transposable element Tcb1 transposase [Trichonephila clavipes]|nr:transposable element Tcb1 transposase [Trichonephila clavipes]
MQQGTTDRRGRSHPPQCSTSRKDRQILLSVHNIRRRLQQSGLIVRRTLLGLPLTQNHRRLHRQCCDERRIWAAEKMKLSLLTNHAFVCNTTKFGFESGDTEERGC